MSDFVPCQTINNEVLNSSAEACFDPKIDFT